MSEQSWFGWQRERARDKADVYFAGLKVRPLWVRVLLIPVLTWKHRQAGVSWSTAFRCARIILKAKVR